jgi:hypothetical protein
LAELHQNASTDKIRSITNTDKACRTAPITTDKVRRTFPITNTERSPHSSHHQHRHKVRRTAIITNSDAGPEQDYNVYASA